MRTVNFRFNADLTQVDHWIDGTRTDAVLFFVVRPDRPERSNVYDAEVLDEGDERIILRIRRWKQGETGRWREYGGAAEVPGPGVHDIRVRRSGVTFVEMTP